MYSPTVRIFSRSPPICTKKTGAGEKGSVRTQKFKNHPETQPNPTTNQPTNLVVQQGKPVGHPEHKLTAGAGQLVDVDRLHQALRGGKRTRDRGDRVWLATPRSPPRGVMPTKATGDRPPLDPTHPLASMIHHGTPTPKDIIAVWQHRTTNPKPTNLGDVHTPRRLKAIVADRGRLASEKRRQLLLLDALLAHLERQRNALLKGQRFRLRHRLAAALAVSVGCVVQKGVDWCGLFILFFFAGEDINCGRWARGPMQPGKVAVIPVPAAGGTAREPNARW